MGTSTESRLETTNPLDVQVGGDHYKSMGIQVVEYCMANHIGFMEGAVIKYVSRWRFKGGLQDLKKAVHFLEMLISHNEVLECQPPKLIDDRRVRLRDKVSPL